jgi:hypothetical protein
MTTDKIILRGITRVEGTAEGEELVTMEKLSHMATAAGSDGAISMQGDPLKAGPVGAMCGEITALSSFGTKLPFSEKGC